jgi:TRAP-type C4-dicarboxylate transport system permease small subunit
MRHIDRLLRALSTFFLYVAAGAALVMTSLVVLASIMRYLLGSPFRFTEELVALLYLGMVFLTIPNSTVRRQHITVDLLKTSLRPRGRKWLGVASLVVTIAFTAWFAVEAYAFAAFAEEIGARSEQVDILLWPWMALMPSVFAFVCLIAVTQLVRLLAASPATADADEPGQEPSF